MNLVNTSPINGTLAVDETTEPAMDYVSDDAMQRDKTLRDSVEQALQNYFKHLDGQDVTDVYNMVLAEVEAPLLESVMDYVKGNQTRASEVLGLNRGTLRKKLKQYGLL
ncbi:hypothetical protein LCGC14_0232960 [marine sediment metagenome]